MYWSITPSTKNLHIKSHKLMGILRANTGAIGCIVLMFHSTLLFNKPLLRYANELLDLRDWKSGLEFLDLLSSRIRQTEVSYKCTSELISAIRILHAVEQFNAYMYAKFLVMKSICATGHTWTFTGRPPQCWPRYSGVHSPGARPSSIPRKTAGRLAG